MDFETQRRNLVVNSLMDRKSMQALKEANMIKSGSAKVEHHASDFMIFSIRHFGEPASRAQQ